MNKKKKKQILQYLAAKLSWLMVLAFGTVARARVVNAHYWRQARTSKNGMVYLVWHGRMLLPLYLLRNRGIVAMVSEHGDGEVIAQAIIRLGYKTIRGSSTRGGSKALRAMIKKIKAGAECTILPDGPRGPRCELKMGALMLAQVSGACLLPVSASSQKPIFMNSWDRFTMWRPFSKSVVVFGEPIIIPRKLPPDELENWRLYVENKMKALDQEADEMVRH